MKTHMTHRIVTGTIKRVGVYTYVETDVQPSPDDLDNKIHPTTLPTPGGVPAKGEEMEIVN